MALAAALVLLGGCFSPEAYTEHLCRTCTSECPEGLTCHGGRCVRACDASCFGDFECVDSVACLPKSGEQCPASSVSLALCVGKLNERDIASEMSSDASSDEPWVVLHSELPEGVSFDPETGKLSGTPARAEPGSITVRHGEPGSEELSVDLQATESCVSIGTERITWCRGKDENHLLVASLPGQYRWVLSGSSAPGVALQGDTLTGNVVEVGSYELRIELHESGVKIDTATLELTVEDCGDGAPPELVARPLEITTLAALPNACEGVDYAADFEATGGQGDYRWTLETELAGLALAEATGTLTGTPLASGDFDLTVSVDDSASHHDSITAVLHVVSAAEECTTGPLQPTEEEACGAGQAATCPRAPLGIVTTDLGVACVGAPFSAQLEARGGGGDYRWGLSSSAPSPAPSWLELEITGELHTVPGADVIGEHHFSVWVTSTLNDGAVFGTINLEVVSCDALVFLTDEPGADRLFRTRPGADAVAEISAGVLGAGDSVHSFALSADGAHLAFDVTNEGAPSRLYWVDLATLDVRQPTFDPALPAEASVIEYRWSLDGSQLAAVFRDDDQLFLGVSPAAGGPGSSVFVTGRFGERLFWVGERICYVGPYFAAQSVIVLCHSITPDGVEDRTTSTGGFAQDTFRSDLLLGNDEAYLAILSGGLRAQYIVPDDLSASVQHIDHVFSPGLYRGAGPSDEASIFDVFTSRGVQGIPIPLAQLDPCDKLDAWSFDERSIACASDGSLAIHQLDADGALVGGAVVEDSEGYPEEEFRRLLAPGGQWYAYDAGDELRVVALDAAPARSRAIVPGGARGLYAGLGTDASGAHLYYHHGSDLDVVDTRANFQVRNLNGEFLLSDPSPCNEAQLDDGPRLWCGAQSIPSFFFPAPAAPFVAFVDRQRQLYVADVAASVGAQAAPRLVPAPSVKCTMDSGETACDNFVQWVPRREPR